MALEWAEAPGEPVSITVSQLDPRPLGTVASLESRLEGLDRRRDRAHAEIGDAHQEIDRARAQLGQPFARAEELRAEMTELATATPVTADVGPDTPEPAAAEPPAAEPDAAEPDAAELDTGPVPTEQQQPGPLARPQQPAHPPEPDPAQGEPGAEPDQADHNNTGAEQAPSPGEPRGARRAPFDQIIADHAAEYGGRDAPTGGGSVNAARYLVEGHLPHATGAEWGWLEAHLRRSPELMGGPVLTQQQRAERVAQRDADGDGLAADARRHFDAGDYQGATSLIDRAEVANPTQADKWDRIRSVIDHAREATPSADTAAGERDQQLSTGQDGAERGRQGADPAHHAVEPADEKPDRVGLGSGAVERARAAITRRNTERTSLDDADFERRSAAEPDPGIAPEHQIERD